MDYCNHRVVEESTVYGKYSSHETAGAGWENLEFCLTEKQ